MVMAPLLGCFPVLQKLFADGGYSRHALSHKKDALAKRAQ